MLKMIIELSKCYDDNDIISVLYKIIGELSRNEFHGESINWYIEDDLNENDCDIDLSKCKLLINSIYCVGEPVKYYWSEYYQNKIKDLENKRRCNK